LLTVLNTTVLFFILNMLQGEHYLLNNGIVVLTSYYIIPVGVFSVVINLLAFDHVLETAIASIFSRTVPANQTVQLA
jgi:hypothetical protein